MSNIAKRLIGESIEDVLAYQRLIEPQIELAKKGALQAEADPRKQEAISTGHGVYEGSCGHIIRQCRCSHGVTVKVDAPCEVCSKKVQEASEPLPIEKACSKSSLSFPATGRTSGTTSGTTDRWLAIR